MRIRLRPPMILLLVAGLAGCGDDSTAPRTVTVAAERPAERSVLYTQSATGGTFAPADGGTSVLTLRGVSPRTVWFENRPGRRAGRQATARFVRSWDRLGFEDDPPNAALHIFSDDVDADTSVVELLGRPRYDAKRRTLRYEVRVLDAAGPGAGTDAGIPRRFSDASLFIDDAPNVDDDRTLPASGTQLDQAQYELLAFLRPPEPILVVFGANWCGQCRLLDGQINQYRQRSDAVTTYRIDTDEVPAAATRWAVRQLPSVVLLKGGAIPMYVRGTISATDLARKINAAR